MVYSRDNMPRPCRSSTSSRFTPLPVTRARSTGMRRGCDVWRQTFGEKRSHVRRLVLLDIDEEQIRRVFADLQRELPEQIHLQSAHSHDEKRPQADGEQNDPV